ncbi:MAG: hypothetical protein A2005_11985 [Desulfuromonadales bacterium GWC2_61_20]|nr:MAG: hypothetical protein A2005_11985 [Desulfuromonadales bacterium GWC2_61_20]
MVRYYDAADRKDLLCAERTLSAAGIEYAETPPLPGSGLSGAIGIAEEDLPRAAEVLDSARARARH